MLLAKGNLNNEKTAFDIQFDIVSAVLFLNPLHLWWLHFFKVYNTNVSAFLGTTASPEL